MNDYLLDEEYDEKGNLLSFDGFVSEDGQHLVVWKEVELVPNAPYEVWWCIKHDRLYYGGCS